MITNNPAKTPQDALAYYRDHVPSYLRKHAQAFAAMPVADQAELMFYMLAGIGETVAHMVIAVNLSEDDEVEGHA